MTEEHRTGPAVYGGLASSLTVTVPIAAGAAFFRGGGRIDSHGGVSGTGRVVAVAVGLGVLAASRPGGRRPAAVPLRGAHRSRPRRGEAGDINLNPFLFLVLAVVVVVANLAPQIVSYLRHHDFRHGFHLVFVGDAAVFTVFVVSLVVAVLSDRRALPWPESGHGSDPAGSGVMTTFEWRVLPVPGVVAFGVGVGAFVVVQSAAGTLLAGLAASCSAALVLVVWHRSGEGWAVVDAAVAVAMGLGAVRHHGAWTAGSVEPWLDTLLVAGLLLSAAALVAGVARVVSGGRPNGVARGEEGLATAELVILVPVLLAVIGLAVIGGRITTATGHVQSAVRAAARAGSLQRNPADAQAAADQVAQSELQAAGVSCGSYSLQFAAGPPGGVDRATLSCVVPLGGVEWMNLAPSKTIVESFSSPVDAYRQGT